MKNFRNLVVLVLMVVNFSWCSKTGIITSKEALLNTSVDTLHFDTLFTTTGSVADRFKIFNPNQQKLVLSNVRLVGGATSPFKINVDGVSGTNFNNIELEAGDSLYVFVTVSINPGAANLPFLVQDSISIQYNGNEKLVQLDAFGQNARFLRNQTLTRNTTFDNSLPIVILGGLQVAPGVTLTVSPGTKFYAHADAPLIINGTLLVNGDRFDSTLVTFQGDRLDPDFRDYPGSWPGIYFSETSRNNVLNYAIIRNAYQGIILQQPAIGGNAKVILNECRIDNIYDAGIISDNSSISARNCLITNCGYNIALLGGGVYNFNHCTVASYSNLFVNHKNPVLSITNANSQNQTNTFSALFQNCIFYGDSGIVKNEIVAEKKGTSLFSLAFENVLYRNKDAVAVGTFTNSINTNDPEFESIDNSKRLYDFRLKSSSPAVNAGKPTGLLFDLAGKARGGPAGVPDIGCFEF